MAASSSMESIFLANNLVAYGARNNKSVGPFSDGKKEQPSTVTNASKNPPPSNTPFPSKVSTKFSDLLAFSGPAPERINGRLAMVGFVSALASGSIQGTGCVCPDIRRWSLVVRVSVESKSNGIMTSDAELLNGRLAMLGLVALALTEYVTRGTLD
ncbi:unnamed protein product [Prunus armeniaca]